MSVEIAFAYLFTAAAAVAIIFFLTRWIFAINKQLYYQRYILKLLIMIAREKGLNVSDESFLKLQTDIYNKD